jgi:hypothetical protein
MSMTSDAQRRSSGLLVGSRVCVLTAMTLAVAFLTISGSASASSSPSIDSISVSGITEHDATLEAQINPGSLETTYQFHLSSPACQSHWPVIGPCFTIEEFSLPSGSVAAASGDQTVRLDVNSAGVTLEPGRWYEYSVTAHNAAGDVSAGGSGEQDFKTLSMPLVGSPEPPYKIEPLLEAITLGSNPAAAAAPLIVTPPADTSKTTTTTRTTTDALTAATLTRAQKKLAKALKLCDRKPKRQKASCHRRAHKTYGASGRQASRKRHKD